MAEKGKDTLKGYFNTGDIPTESQFADLIDSYPNIQDGGLDSIETRLDNLEENQYTGVKVYGTLAELPNPGTLLVSYKVANDTTENNGYYHWTGAAYVKDAGLDDYIETGKNLFDKDAITTGYYVDYTTGNLVANANYNATDWMPVLAETTYNRSKNSGGFGQFLHWAWYDSDKVFISGGNTSVYNITSPVGAAFVRCSLSVATYEEDYCQFEIGDEQTVYNPFIQRFTAAMVQVYPTSFPDGMPFAAYVERDEIKNTVIIDANGRGDYTSIAAAYAAVTDCSFENQYAFIIMPGIYEEGDLAIPDFSHTYGLYPNSVVVQYGAGNEPVFDFNTNSGKLSNMLIYHYGAVHGYCLHYDGGGDFAIRVLENITFKHLDSTGSIIGGGSWDNYEPVFKNCFYIADAGDASCHTQVQETLGRTIVRHHNESIGGRSFALNSVGGQGYHVAEFVNCKGTKGKPSVVSSVAETPLRTSTNWWEYPANRNEWQFIGGGNKDFVVYPRVGNMYGQALLFTAGGYNDNFMLSGTALECLFGNYFYTKGGTRIYPKAKGFWDVRDIQNNGGIDVIQMWKRLGDCSIVNKTLTLSLDAGGSQTYTFTDNYLVSQPAESVIIAAINAVITNAVLSKIDGSDNFDNVKMAEKIIVLCTDANSILKGEFLMTNAGTVQIAATNTPFYNIVGVAVTEAIQGEPLEIWSGPLRLNGYASGEYGIGSDGKLDITQSNKVGCIVGSYFYPYY